MCVCVCVCVRACVPFAHSLFLVVANERGQETKKNSPTRFNCALHSIFPRHPPSSASGRVSTLFAASTRSCCAHRRSSHRCSSSQPPFSRRGQTHGRCAAVNDRACFFLGGWGGALFSCYSGCVRAYMHAACVCVCVCVGCHAIQKRDTLLRHRHKDTHKHTQTRRHTRTHTRAPAGCLTPSCCCFEPWQACKHLRQRGVAHEAAAHRERSVAQRRAYPTATNRF